MNYSTWKRGMDMAGAAVLLMASAPVWALVAVAVLVLQGRPVLFRQQRMGLGNRPFMLLKFRTMRDGAPSRLPDRPVAKRADDSRITPIGGLLRRTALDELPQLLNVLRGEMSLVGPRPLPVEDLAQPGWLEGVAPEECARRRDWAVRRHEVTPGLTGLWQVTANDPADFDNWIACDLAYLAGRGLRLDLAILLRTPWAVARGRRRPAAPSPDPVALPREG